MHLVPVSIESIPLNKPLPFPLLDKNGVLLAKRSYIIRSREDLAAIAQRGGGLFLDVTESEASHRAYLERLHGLIREGKPIGEIASAEITGNLAGGRTTQDEERPDWLDVQVHANTLLHDIHASHFKERLDRLIRQLDRYSHQNPDGTLFALIHLSATEVKMYSATHAMLVSVMCGLAAREVLKWPPEQESLLCKAALTMNLGMTALQDQLAKQVEAPSPKQRQAIDGHAALSAEMLMELGVTDSVWLDAVREHHTQTPGPLSARSPTQQIARLIQRADMFAARLAPRASRLPISPAAAMQACYFDENRQVDETGAALIKAVGIYQPGSFVRLASDEVAIVIKRGRNTSTPRVAVLISRSGMPVLEPTVRETSSRDFRIVASVPHREVKVQVNLDRLLPLTETALADRPW